MSNHISGGKIKRNIVNLSPAEFSSQSGQDQPSSCWTWIYPAFANSVDPDQLASEDWSGSALFVLKYLNSYKPSRSSHLIGWKLEVGLVS